MTEEEMQKIVDMIVEQLFIRINDEAKAMNEEFINSLPSNDEQIIELNLLLKHMKVPKTIQMQQMYLLK